MTRVSERVLNQVLRVANQDGMSERARNLLDQANDFTFADLGINSVDAQGVLKTIGDEFGVEIPAAEVASWKNLRDLTDFLDARS